MWDDAVGCVDAVRWWGVALTIVAVAWGGNQFTPLLTMYQQVAGFDDFTVRLLLFAYVVGLIPSLLGSSWVARRTGLRLPMLLALGLSAVGSALIAIGADSVPLMFAGRTLIGIALGTGMVLGGTCGITTAFSALLCLISLGPGFFVQRIVGRIQRAERIGSCVR